MSTAVHSSLPDLHIELLTPDEVSRLVRASSSRASTGIRNRALITALYRCGLRVSEALSLGTSDLDRDARQIRVQGRSRVRTIGLDPGSFHVVECWIDRRQELGITSEPLFCTLKGAGLSSSYLRGLLHRLADKAGIEKRVSAEVLRRTLAFELAQEGFSMAEIQAQLGHASVVTTSRYFARGERAGVIPSMQRRTGWHP